MNPAHQTQMILPGPRRTRGLISIPAARSGWRGTNDTQAATS